MLKKILLILTTNIIITKDSHFSDNHDFTEYSKFLNINLNSNILSTNKIFSKTQKNSKFQKKAICIINKNIINKNEYVNYYDSGYLSCDWEISQIEIECKNDFITKIILKMRNFKNSQKKYLNGRQNNEIDELLRVPKKTWIRGIIKEFYKDGNKKKYLIGLKILYNNNKKKYLSCVENLEIYDFVKITEKIILKKFERFSGYISLKNKLNTISDLYFYKSSLKGLNNILSQKLTFSEIINKYQIQYKSAKEKSKKIENFGINLKNRFSDKIINSSWKLSKLIYYVNKNSIEGIKTNFVHNYFKVPFKNKIHFAKNFNEDICEKIEIVINLRYKIKKIKIKQNYKGNICGVIFIYKNGKRTRDTCEGNHNERDFEINKNVHFIGFHGSFGEYSLSSLGVLIREKRGVFID